MSGDCHSESLPSEVAQSVRPPVETRIELPGGSSDLITRAFSALKVGRQRCICPWASLWAWKLRGQARRSVAHARPDDLGQLSPRAIAEARIAVLEHVADAIVEDPLRLLGRVEALAAAKAIEVAVLAPV